MPPVKDEVQLLRVHEQGNTSQVLVMLGRGLGQFHVHAKGARRWPRKGFEGGFDLLLRGEVVVYPRRGESLWVFKEWEERARPAFGPALDALNAASYLCELAETLTRHDSGTAVEDAESNFNASNFDLLAAAADALAAGADPGIILLNYTCNALRIAGSMPTFSRCQRCERKLPEPNKRAWLDSAGLCCAECLPAQMQSENRRGIWLSPESQRAIVYIARSACAPRISAQAAGEMARAMILLVHGALERDLRTLQAAAELVRRVVSAAL